MQKGGRGWQSLLGWRGGASFGFPPLLLLPVRAGSCAVPQAAVGRPFPGGAASGSSSCRQVLLTCPKSQLCPIPAGFGRFRQLMPAGCPEASAGSAGPGACSAALGGLPAASWRCGRRGEVLWHACNSTKFLTGRGCLCTMLSTVCGRQGRLCQQSPRSPL